MRYDPWSEEQIRKLSYSVLARGVERFREALQHLGDAQSQHVTRLRRGLGVMQRELKRRRLARQAQRRPAGGGGAPVRLAEAAGGPPNQSSNNQSSNNQSSNDRPRAADRESEPVWRLIPHLNESSSKIVSVLDEEGVIRHQSDPVKWLLGFDAETLVGQSLEAVLCGSSRERAEEAVDRMARGEEKFDTWRFEFRTASGETFWLEGMASNFLRDPRLGGILVYWRELAGR